MVLRAKLDEVSSQQKELESRHIQLQEAIDAEQRESHRRELEEASDAEQVTEKELAAVPGAGAVAFAPGPYAPQ